MYGDLQRFFKCTLAEYRPLTTHWHDVERLAESIRSAESHITCQSLTEESGTPLLTVNFGFSRDESDPVLSAVCKPDLADPR